MEALRQLLGGEKIRICFFYLLHLLNFLTPDSYLSFSINCVWLRNKSGFENFIHLKGIMLLYQKSYYTEKNVHVYVGLAD